MEAQIGSLKLPVQYCALIKSVVLMHTIRLVGKLTAFDLGALSI
jgi:hypothetical protein